jgi:VIT1/CCC1 family predicted Fe2+/Mn2+ transporter
VFGVFPLLPYLINRATHSEPSSLLIGSLCIGGFFLFSLGFAKAILLGTNKLIAGGLSLLLGAAAVAAGFGVGTALKV